MVVNSSNSDGSLSFDIGLMPLPLEEWSQGKSGGKARTYMAAGIVPVCTSIGYNQELIDSGRTGFLVESLSDWEDQLSLLIESPELRKKIGIAAREEVEERFSISGQAQKLKDVFDEVVSKSKTMVRQKISLKTSVTD